MVFSTELKIYKDQAALSKLNSFGKKNKTDHQAVLSKLYIIIIMIEELLIKSHTT
jgi:hypothetical protein